jgi:MFS family permease
MRSSRLRNNLRASTGDAASFSTMVGLGETYLPAFALAVGSGDVSSGLVATVPMLMGAVGQMITPAAVWRLGSHRRWVLWCAIVQACSFLPFAAAAAWGRLPTPAIFLIAAVYWGTGLGTAPAWNTWAGTIVPRRVRARYFGRRARFGNVGTLVGFLAGGLMLEVGKRCDLLMLAFAAAFLLAAAARFTSAAFLATQTEPQPLPKDHRVVPLGEMLGRLADGDGRLLIYMVCLQTAVQIAGPYFTPHMLGQLRFSYWQYVAVLATGYLAKVVTLPALGSLAHRLGARWLLWFGGLGIVPMSACWVVSDSLPWLLAVQLASGTVWAAYELATALLFFETIPERERTSVLTAFNLANAVAIALGSLIGGTILTVGGGDRSAYLTLFVASSSMRLLTVMLLARAAPRRPRLLVESDAFEPLQTAQPKAA